MRTRLEAFQRLDSRFRGNDKQGGNDEGDAFPWSPYPKLGLLLAMGLCRGVLVFSDQLLTGTVLPAIGASVLVGNAAYALQAWCLGRQEGSYHRTACSTESTPSACWPTSFW